jgi:hypothetical protein
MMVGHKLAAGRFPPASSSDNLSRLRAACATVRIHENKNIEYKKIF